MNDQTNRALLTIFWIGVIIFVICLIWFIVEIVRYNMILDEFARDAKMIHDGQMFFLVVLCILNMV